MINLCVLINHSLVQFDMKYYYEVGAGGSKRQFWFSTPPALGPDVPYTFGIIGTTSPTRCYIWLCILHLQPRLFFFLVFIGSACCSHCFSLCAEYHLILNLFLSNHLFCWVA